MSVTYAVPKSLIMRTQICDYCANVSVRSATAEHHLHGIKCCEAHLALGTRDTNAWLRKQKLVRQKDFLAIHGALADMKINVPRTDGSVTSGANLSEEPYQFLYNKDGWRCRVLFTDPATKEIMSKSMKLDDLDKSGVSAQDIAAWTETLDNFYSEDHTAYVEAVNKGSEKECDVPCIKKVSVNGTECRVFVP
jgi:hypothetical protein